MAKKKKDTNEPGTIENRRARFDYHISETLEVGIAFQGSEIKAVRDGKVSLGEGYISAKDDPPRLDLLNVNIGEYAPAGTMGHRPTRSRALLAKKAEIRRLAKMLDQKGMTIVPLKLYFKAGWAKLLIGVAKGKQAHDKRQAIGEREAKRDVQRAMSRRRE